MNIVACVTEESTPCAFAHTENWLKRPRAESEIEQLQYLKFYMAASSTVYGHVGKHYTDRQEKGVLRSPSHHIPL